MRESAGKGEEQEVPRRFRFILRLVLDNKDETQKRTEALGETHCSIDRLLKPVEQTFRNLLQNQSESVDLAKLTKKMEAAEGDDKEGEGETKKGYPVPGLIAPEVAQRVRGLAEGMIQSGEEKLCLKTFKDLRKAKLEAGLRGIGVEKLSQEEVELMEGKELEKRIKGWRNQIELALHVVLMAECNLVEECLKDMEPHCGRTFADLAEFATQTLFTFAQAVSNSKKTPPKLALLVDMYKTMRELMPQVNVVFAGQACSGLRTEARGVLQNLAAAAKEAVAAFEEAVLTEDCDKVPADGSRHGLTSYVVNYLKYLCDYQAVLQEVDSLAEASAGIFTALQKNLENKAKLYKDPAQAELFLMNNMHHIVQGVKKSELREILGDGWVERHRRTVQQHAGAYQQKCWNPVFQMLTPKGLTTGGGGKDEQVSTSALKERFRTFNILFEELHRTQCLWKIPDPELCSAVQLRIAEVLLPAYRSFVQRYKPMLEVNPFAEGARHIKFTDENLDALLKELFQGKESCNVLEA